MSDTTVVERAEENPVPETQPETGVPDNLD